jgi:TRAP-type mannitol/chloroaromatic compound transport system permease small subunit
MSGPPVSSDAALPVEELPQTALSQRLEAGVRWIGKTTSWIWAALVVVIIYNVVQRYVFGIGAIWLEELQWHFYAIGFTIGLSYAMVADRHVRVDVLAERWSPRRRAWVEMFGLLFLLLPFSISIFVEAVPYWLTSYRLDESSAAPGGLANLWILKSFILWGFGLLALAAFARLLRCMAMLFGWPKPIWPRD